MEHVIVRALFGELIVQSKLVQMIVHMLDSVTMECVTATQDLKAKTVPRRSVQTIALDMVIADAIISLASVILVGLDMTAL